QFVLLGGWDQVDGDEFDGRLETRLSSERLGERPSLRCRHNDLRSLGCEPLADFGCGGLQRYFESGGSGAWPRAPVEFEIELRDAPGKVSPPRAQNPRLPPFGRDGEGGQGEPPPGGRAPAARRLPPAPPLDAREHQLLSSH